MGGSYYKNGRFCTALTSLIITVLWKVWRNANKGRWRTKWNFDIYNLYKAINIVDDFKIKRPEWAGLIIRMKDEKKNPKKSF